MKRIYAIFMLVIMLNIFIFNNVHGIVVYNEDEFIDAVSNDEISNIILGNNINLSTYLKNKPIYIKLVNNRTIDLNGNKLTTNYSDGGGRKYCSLVSEYIWNNSSLTIKDSKKTGSIDCNEFIIGLWNKSINSKLIFKDCDINIYDNPYIISSSGNEEKTEVIFDNCNLNIYNYKVTIYDNVKYNVIDARIRSMSYKYLEIDGVRLKISDVVNKNSDIYIDDKIIDVDRNEPLEYFIRYEDGISINEKKYKVEFNTDGGTYIEPQYVSYNSLINEIDPPERDGYEFKGWSKNGEKFAISKTPITEDVVLEAIWEKDGKYLNKNDVTIDYTNIYKGIDTKPTPIVVRRGIKLKEGTDYEYIVDEEDQRLVVMGRGEYQGVIVLYYDIMDIQYIQGDLDRNSVVDANDASIALEIFKAENATTEDIAIGDMDGNNLIDANDASLILELYKTNN